MRPGDSVFVPTWDTEELRKQLREIVPFKWRMEVRIEDGYRGVRIWRVR